MKTAAVTVKKAKAKWFFGLIVCVLIPTFFVCSLYGFDGTNLVVICVTLCSLIMFGLWMGLAIYFVGKHEQTL